MNKVVCANCGLVNLEKFVTFPHCAACGAHLPQATPEKVEFWRRPVRAPVWASAIGVCCAALGILGAVVTRESRPAPEKQLVVYMQLPRRVPVGQNGALQLGLDTLDDEAESGAVPFQNVRLRLERQALVHFALVSIAPPPDARTALGNGRYFEWNQIRRDQPIRLTVRPRQEGEHRLNLRLLARGFMAFEMRYVIDATRRVPLSVPNSKGEKNHVQRRR